MRVGLKLDEPPSVSNCRLRPIHTQGNTSYAIHRMVHRIGKSRWLTPILRQLSVQPAWPIKLALFHLATAAAQSRRFPNRVRCDFWFSEACSRTLVVWKTRQAAGRRPTRHNHLPVTLNSVFTTESLQQIVRASNQPSLPLTLGPGHSDWKAVCFRTTSSFLADVANLNDCVILQPIMLHSGDDQSGTFWKPRVSAPGKIAFLYLQRVWHGKCNTISTSKHLFRSWRT